MKTSLTILLLFLMQFPLNHLGAQSLQNINSGFPLNQDKSPLFGKDIVINDQPNQNQRQVVLCSAFNGWLYAEYSYTDPINHSPASTVMISKDNGITWTVFFNGVWPGSYTVFSSMDMIVSGDSISNLKLFLAWVASNSPSTGIGDSYVWRFNGETGVFEDGLLQNNSSYNIAIANDFIFPANNSNPHSLGILYSKYSSSADSIIFCSSSNGGMSLDGRRVVAISGSRFHKVALTYGRSLTWNSGRYFAAWEEQDQFGSFPGRIFTAHTSSEFNSSFTTPVQLDAIDPGNLNTFSDPSIACQYNNLDNDSSNLTEIVLFDRINQSNQSHNIRGYYNLQATSTSHFTRLSLSDSLHNNLQPSINFNPFDSTFMVTYYDSTNQKLPFLLNNFNLNNPDNWQVVTTGYNNDNNLSAPYPKVALNLGQKQGANVWAKEGTGGKGVAMFNAPYSTWTGNSGNTLADNSDLFLVYPNPCNSSLTVAFKLKTIEQVKITLYNLIGKSIGIVTDQTYPIGLKVINYDVSIFSSGSYVLAFRSGDVVRTCKVFIIR